MNETVLLATAAPVAYIIGMIATMRRVVWRAARWYYQHQKYACCESQMKRENQGNWESPAHAMKDAVHNCDWFVAWLFGIFWPLMLPVYLVVKPARWYIIHEPQKKLSSEDQILIAQRNLDAATEAMAKAQED